MDDSKGHSVVTFVLAGILFIWYLIVIGMSVGGAIVVRLRYTAAWPPNTRRRSSTAEGVTILRPLKGIDPEQDACLASAMQQEYPRFELLYLAESEGDAALAAARAMMEKYPDVDARVLVSPENERYGPNPKINNLAKGYLAAKHDIVWVLDSNAWVSPGTLTRSVAALNASPATQIVHHMPMSMAFGPAAQWGARLDEMFMLTAHSKMYAGINAVAIEPCVMGKSNLYRRSALDAAVAAKLGVKAIDPGTGIQHFAQYIAEDNMIAKCLWDHGGRSAMTGDVVVQPLTTFSLTSYCERRIRWLRVRRYMVHAATLIEPTTESLVCGALGSLAASILFLGTGQWWSWTWFLVHMASWCLLDYFHFHNLTRFSPMQRDNSVTSSSTIDVPVFVQKYYDREAAPGSAPRPRPFHRWFMVWAAREVLALPVWVAAMSGQTIYWRGRPFRIRADLSTEELE